jgi:GNAT superfamily N-acetyltransferase
MRAVLFAECESQLKKVVVEALYNHWHELYAKYSRIYSEEDLQNFLLEQYGVFVYLDGNRDFVGTVTLQNDLGTEMSVGYRTFWISNLFVIEEKRNKGYGKAILNHAESYLYDLGVKHVGLMAVDGLEKFYRGVGYRAVGFHPLTRDTVMMKSLENIF